MWSKLVQQNAEGFMVLEENSAYRLLIADDDPEFRETLAEILNPYFQLLLAKSGEEAVEIVEAEEIHIALLDMYMHVLTGLETLRILKQINAAAPCIIISADADDNLRRDATSADAYEVLKKPVRRRELVEIVSTAIEFAYEDLDTAG